MTETEKLWVMVVENGLADVVRTLATLAGEEADRRNNEEAAQWEAAFSALNRCADSLHV